MRRRADHQRLAVAYHAQLLALREAVDSLAEGMDSRDCELYDEDGWDCITAGPEVLAADGCLPCRVRSLAVHLGSDS